MNNDILNECIEKMIESDGIILASPTYFADISTEMKALIDRAGMVAMALRSDSLFLCGQSAIPGFEYWPRRFSG